jgi:BlaI family penicillinase repressor
MADGNMLLTPAEWKLMECLWDGSPKNGREAAEYLKKSAGWTRSTTLTMLRRMTEKGAVRCGETNGMLSYTPAIRRQDAAVRETDDFIERVYHGSVSLLVSSLADRQELSEEDIQELKRILHNAEKEK